MNIRNEITQYAKETDKAVLLWLFNRYHWESQWDFVAKCSHVRYGTMSYETYRVWSPTDEGLAIFKQMAIFDQVPGSTDK